MVVLSSRPCSVVEPCAGRAASRRRSVFPARAIGAEQSVGRAVSPLPPRLSVVTSVGEMLNF